MSSTRKRYGFTLVELLVVIAIIGMLMSLLLPAIQAAREAGRGNTCRSNMRNVALAIFAFDNNRNRYPGVVETVGGKARPLMFMLTPYLERNDIWDAYSSGNATAAAEVTLNNIHWDLLQCPSNPKPIGSSTSIVYNYGAFNSSGHINNKANGVFWSGNSGISSSQVRDGTTQTLMLSENMDATNWTVSGTGVYFAWAQSLSGSDLIDKYRINANNKGTGASGWNTARPSSNHPGSCNVAFLDAHVRKIREDINYGVFVQLMTSKGSSASSPSGYSVPLILDDASF